MKILFIWPNKDSFGFKPMSLALMSAILKQRGHEIELFDTTYIDFGYKSLSEVRNRIRIFKPVDFGNCDVAKVRVDLQVELLKKLDDFRPDVVGVSALSDEVAIGLEVSKIVKQWNSNIPVLWGNKAPTMSPERILADPHVDYVCMGEGIEFITEFFECLSNDQDPRSLRNIAYKDEQGRIRRNELRPYFQDLDSLPFFDWSIFDSRHFLRPYDGNLYIGGDHMIYWGCPYHCTYCINHAYRKLYGPKAGKFLRSYSVDRIIEELQYLVQKWGITFFKFYDEDFCLKPMPYFRELSEKYHNRVNVPFTVQVNARNLNQEKVELMKTMNCVSISIGIETGNEKLRKTVLRRSETKEEIIRAIQMLNDAGIRTCAFNMLGIPFETRNTVMETIELNRKSQVRYPDTVFFYPLEQTDLREVAVRNGYYDNNSDDIFDDVRPSLRLPAISTEELMALRERFVLYVKMPEAYYPYIGRSEASDEVGTKLTDELYKIYDECVLFNDGVWNDRGKNPEYLNHLRQIYHG